MIDDGKFKKVPLLLPLFTFNIHKICLLIGYGGADVLLISTLLCAPRNVYNSVLLFGM